MSKRSRTSGDARSVLGAGVALLLLYHPGAWGTEEIFVTARKIEERVQDIPLSVSAFTANKLSDLNLRSIDDIAKFTPGLSFTSAFGRTSGSDRPAIRGVTTIVNGIANASSVGYFVDGIYLSGTPQSTEIYNLERVEIIKGPQAAQFGRGTYAGAINFITRKPSMDGLDGGVTLTGAEHETYEASAWISAPLVANTLAFYLGAGYDTYGGEYSNRPTIFGEQVNLGEVGGTESVSATGKLLWTPADGLEVTLKGGFLSTDDDHPAIILQGRSQNNAFFRSATSPRAREYYRGTAIVDENAVALRTDLLDQASMSGVELDRTLASLSIAYTEPNGYQFLSTTGIISDEEKTGFDVSYAGYDPLPFGTQAGAFLQLDEDESDSFAQEFRVTSPLDRSLRVTAGVYFLKLESKELVNNRVPFPAAPGTPAVAVPQAGAINLTTERVENRAFFAGLDVDLTDRFTLGLEGRYAQDEVRQFSFLNPQTPGAPLVVDPGCGLDLCQKTFSSFTPRLTARYLMQDGINLYANVARGTKPGDFNASVPEGREDLRAVDEEKLWSYEVGAKTEWLDRRLVANLAVYHNDVEDQQLTQNIEIAGIPQSLLQNVGRTEVWGAELETTFSFTDNLTGGLIAAWTDSEIKERFSADQADLVADITGYTFVSRAQYDLDFGSVAGNQSPRIPEFQFGLFGRYDLPMSWGGLFFASDFSWEDSKFAQEHNLIETGSRSLLGAQIGANWGNWQLTVWGKNLTDDDTPLDVLRYIDRRASEGGALTGCTAPPNNGPADLCAGSSTSGRGFALTLQPGRQIGATLAYRFGG